MIWYLLYPLRGTTEPPLLKPSHPLRSLFARHGSHAARFPLASILISVAIAAILIYPFPFLYTNTFANGSSNLPHHVWTAAQPFQGNAATVADVAMRSIWVHGSYMKALESGVLLEALALQDELLGPMLNFNPRRLGEPAGENQVLETMDIDIRDQMHAINGLRNSSWFFHSPLQYWACSADTITADQDLAGTVNKGSTQATSVNITLRHSIVFSGKRFEDRRLVAADALVITLVHMLNSPMGTYWEKKAMEIAERKSERWRLYPAHGKSIASTLYEFRFQPLSLQDDVLLGMAYAVTVLLFLHSLSKVRAMRSRLGLAIAVTAQLAISTMSSFTICAILKIDLSQIPREAYPLVVLVCGLEDMFRLINAILLTPIEDPPHLRLAEALGRTGHVALAAVSQNLTILWLLSKVVSPGISSFCTFAAIALIFDFIYLNSFFIAVLGVELRRAELSESLNRVAKSSHPSPVLESNATSWTNTLLRGDAPLSTRIAGTAVMVGFILIAQRHFFNDISGGVMRFVRGESVPTPSSMYTVDINQARSPTAWLRMQDHETAHEVIKVIKPHAHSFVARVYDPLIFVLSDSDRTRTTSGVRRFLPAAYDFVRHQLASFILIIIILIAAVCLLMNYLLYDESTEQERDDDDHANLVVRALPRGHLLDIALMAYAADCLVTVGLDKTVRTWDPRTGRSHCIFDPIMEVEAMEVRFVALAIDPKARYVALLTTHHGVLVWSLEKQSWDASRPVGQVDRRPLHFDFVTDKQDGGARLILVRRDASMLAMDLSSDAKSQLLQICRSPLVEIRAYTKMGTRGPSESRFRLMTTSQRGCIHHVSYVKHEWISEEVHLPAGGVDDRVKGVLPLPQITAVLVVYAGAVHLLHSESLALLHAFQTGPLLPHTLRCHITKQSNRSDHVESLKLVYTDAESGACIVQCHSPESGHSICFAQTDPGEKQSCGWTQSESRSEKVAFPGEWQLLRIGHIIGIRKAGIDSEHDVGVHHPVTGLRRRGGRRQVFAAKSGSDTQDEGWQAWCLPLHGEQTTCPIPGSSELLVNKLGPMVPVNRHSLAIAVGNVVHIITMGREHDDAADESDSTQIKARSRIGADSRIRRHGREKEEDGPAESNHRGSQRQRDRDRDRARARIRLGIGESLF